MLKIIQHKSSRRIIQLVMLSSLDCIHQKEGFYNTASFLDNVIDCDIKD